MESPKTSQHERFSVGKATLRSDRIASLAIRLGGIAILLMVFGILLFVVWQVLPLFRGAKVMEGPSRTVAEDDYVLMGVDEWAEYPFLLTKDGAFHFFRMDDAQPAEILKPEGLGQARSEAWSYQQELELVTMATDDGKGFVVKVDYQPQFDNQDQRIGVKATLLPVVSFDTGAEGVVQTLDYDQTERQGLYASIERGTGGTRLRAQWFQRQVGLLSSGKWNSRGRADLTAQLSGRPTQVCVGGHADLLLVATDHGVIEVFQLRSNKLTRLQGFSPFEEDEGPIVLMNWLAGRRSLVVGNETGELRLFSPASDADSGQMTYSLARDFKSLPGAPTLFAASTRNRVFLVGSGDEVSLRYGTTGARLWSDILEQAPRYGLIGSRYKNLLFYTPGAGLSRFTLDDPHPEASIEGFFGKVRYEGQSEARYVWQSTGGGDGFEPKLSLVPLLIGTLKGTLYAMLFAVPIALASALYSAQFLSLRMRRIVKPAMEIMASLPSVVLGFLAALWLAPLIDDHVPSILLGLLCVPVFAIAAGSLWSHAPSHLRKVLPEGLEFLPMLPIVILAFAFGWWMGPLVEHLFFTVSDPTTGAVTADFRLWWQERIGMDFEQRNALVVGFMMGFAVIPIIFTLSEDAMENVPPTLVSGSLALGAGRWETSRRIVLPMAMPGIFSALMIGLGRAVGETMIVVMATGNTPLTDFNLFSGMRTLAANIAVELPEAPFQGTLYRTLFLGAMLLFILTFLINTVAEITRSRIRRRYQNI